MKSFFKTDEPELDQRALRVIVQRGEPLNDKEIDEALGVPEATQWRRALIQLIEQLKTEHIDSAYQWSAYNNPLGQARDIGAMEACDELLTKLETRVVKSSL